MLGLSKEHVIIFPLFIGGIAAFIWVAVVVYRRLRATKEINPFFPGFAILAVWLLQTLFLFFLFKHLPLIAAVVIKYALSLFAFLAVLLGLVVTVALLIRKRFSAALTSLVFAIVALTVTYYIDMQIAPMRLRATVGGVTNAITQRAPRQSYGDSPRRICEDIANGRYLCRDCKCKPEASLFTEDGVAKCESRATKGAPAEEVYPAECTEPVERTDLTDPYKSR
jgi:hypothetical protein